MVLRASGVACLWCCVLVVLRVGSVVYCPEVLRTVLVVLRAGGVACWWCCVLSRGVAYCAGGVACWWCCVLVVLRAGGVAY